jgi:hypothetical protein
MSCLKRPPPNPEVVAVLPNSDLSHRSATPDQHDAFIRDNHGRTSITEFREPCALGTFF